MVFILIHNCSLLQKSSVKAVQITMIRCRWDWVNWLEVVSLWSLPLAERGQFSLTEEWPQRTAVPQMKILRFSPVPTLCFCLSVTWLFSLVYSCMKYHQNGGKWMDLAALWHPVLQYFSLLDSWIHIECYKAWPGRVLWSLPGKGAGHTVTNVITSNLYDENKQSHICWVSSLSCQFFLNYQLLKRAIKIVQRSNFHR